MELYIPYKSLKIQPNQYFFLRGCAGVFVVCDDERTVRIVPDRSLPGHNSTSFVHTPTSTFYEPFLESLITSEPSTYYDAQGKNALFEFINALKECSTFEEFMIIYKLQNM